MCIRDRAMIEYIAGKIKCITLFSTHYHELTFLEEKNLGIKNVHASASIENDDLVFLYRIKPVSYTHLDVYKRQVMP